MGLFDFWKTATAEKRARLDAQRAAEKAIRIHLRNYEGAKSSHRTDGWYRSGGDAVTSSLAVQTLRNVGRDLIRNNGWARNANRVIAGCSVGWGIRARGLPDGIGKDFDKWAKGTACHVRGKLNFYKMQRLIVETMFQSGGVLLVRRFTGSPEMPLQIDILEPDYIDAAKSDFAVGKLPKGNRIRQGIEFDQNGKVVAYWLKDGHPGAMDLPALTSKRVSAENVLYVYNVERPEQIHGIPWLCASMVKIKEFDEYSDARLLQSKIAACFGAFVRDPNGDGLSAGLGPKDGSNPKSTGVDSLEPGMVKYLLPGEDITFATPPAPGLGSAQFSKEQLQEISAGLGLPYEDLTGDFSNANYSTLRAGRENLRATVEDIRWNILAPQALDPIMSWFIEAYSVAKGGPLEVEYEWTPPPTRLLDPEKEGPAYRRLVRAGLMTPSEAVAEMGKDPKQHWEEYERDIATLDEKGIILDSDPRKTTDTGQKQMETAGKTVSDANA